LRVHPPHRSASHPQKVGPKRGKEKKPCQRPPPPKEKRKNKKQKPRRVSTRAWKGKNTQKEKKDRKGKGNNVSAASSVCWFAAEPAGARMA
jgi:hypothetical protein